MVHRNNAQRWNRQIYVYVHPRANFTPSAWILDYVREIHEPGALGWRLAHQLDKLSYACPRCLLPHGCRNKEAVIAITLEHRDAGIRELYFEQFLELKDLLHNTLEEEWNWEKQVILPDGREISRIGKTLSGASIFNKRSMPNPISFFKPRIIALDSLGKRPVELWRIAIVLHLQQHCDISIKIIFRFTFRHGPSSPPRAWSRTWSSSQHR